MLLYCDKRSYARSNTSASLHSIGIFWSSPLSDAICAYNGHQLAHGIIYIAITGKALCPNQTIPSELATVYH